MRNLLLPYCLIILLSLVSFAQAQELDSAILLQEVRVEALRLKNRTGFEQALIDSISIQQYQSSNIGELLQQESSLFIRSYGVSGHATPSIRGTGASHTQVYWNGLLINSPTLGQIDLTTLPVAMNDAIAVNYGGGSLLEGSGGLGGSISLSSQPLHKQLRLNISATNTQNIGGNLLYAYGQNRLRGSTKVVWLENKNAFHYQGLGQKEQIMEHASHQSRGFLQTLSYRLKPSQQLHFASWYQQDKRELQPSLFVNLYDERLLEKVWRNSLRYEVKKTDYNLKINGGWFYNQLPQVERMGELPAEKGHINTFQAKAHYYKKLKGHTYLRSGIDLMHSAAVATAFQGKRDQQRASLLAGLETALTDQFIVDALLRQEWVSGGHKGRLLPSLALRYQLTPTWSVALNGSYNYRVLSLNEQYWASESRRNLLPEESRNIELLVQQQPSLEEHFWKQSLSLFSYWVENWIIWVPGMPSWKPENATEVYSRGLAYTFSWKSEKEGNWKWGSKGSYTLSAATNQQSFRGNQEAIGKQLIFTPRHKASLQGQLYYKNWSLSFDELYVGKRFSRSDESEYLPAYWLSQLGLGYQHPFKEQLLSARLNIHNLFGYHYQVIPFYAMPGRVWELSLTYQLDL